MSDLIDPQGRPVPTSPRSGLVMDDPVMTASASDESALRAAAYSSPLEYSSVDSGPVLIRSPDLNLQNRGVLISLLAMATISFLLFWAPLIGSVLAGLVGGFFAKRWGRAFTAAGIASVAIPLALFVLDSMKATGSLRFLDGLGFGGWVFLHVLGLFAGAAMGVYSCPLVDRSGGLRRELPEYE